MAISAEFVAKLEYFGVGHRGFGDELFANDKPPQRLGIFDEDEDNLCHELVKTSCHIPGCSFTAESLMEFENHYNVSHRYSCCQCKKSLPSPHLLDLHVQEMHDSFFAVLSTKKPSYSCYIEECKEKFNSPAERSEHCTKVHKLPKDFRFDLIKHTKVRKTNSKNPQKMEVEEVQNRSESSKVKFVNNKQKVFSSQCTRKSDDKKIKTNLDVTMRELKESLPE